MRLSKRFAVIQTGKAKCQKLCKCGCAYYEATFKGTDNFEMCFVPKEY